MTPSCSRSCQCFPFTQVFSWRFRSCTSSRCWPSGRCWLGRRVPAGPVGHGTRVPFVSACRVSLPRRDGLLGTRWRRVPVAGVSGTFVSGDRVFHHPGPAPVFSRAWPRALALGLLGFIVTGFHELVALALLGRLSQAPSSVLVERRPNPGIWLVLLVFVAVGTAVSVQAPGNAERGAIDFPHGRSVSYGIIGLARLLMRILRWIDLKLVVASVLLTLTFGSQLCSSQQDPSDRTRMRKWGFPLAGASILLGICAALTYVTGGLGPERSHNLLYMTFCIAWFTSLVTVLKNAGGLPYWRIRSSVRPLRNVAAAFFCVSLIGSMNHGIGTRDLLFVRGALATGDGPALRACSAGREAERSCSRCRLFLRSLLQPRSGGTWTSDLTQISQSISSLRSTSGSDRFVCKTSPRPWTRADRRGGE